MKKNSILRQITIVKTKPTAALVGFLLGGVMPVVSHHIAHEYTKQNPAFWFLVFGGLLTSGPKVYRWTVKIFGTRKEAWGFIILGELAMVLISSWASYVLLAILVIINGIECAFKLICERPDQVTTQTTEQMQHVQAKRKRTQPKRKAAQPKPQTEQPQETAPALTLATVPAFELVPVPAN